MIPKVGVVIVAYNNPEYLERCLKSIQQYPYANLEIIVVDNSTINEMSLGQPKFENIHYQKTNENLGFCTGCNIGIDISLRLGTDYTLLLNFDTVLEEGAIAKLVARAESLANPGIIGAKILYLSQPDRIWYAGGYLSRLMGVGKHYGFNEKDNGQYNLPQRVTYVTGCCMLVPTRVFKVLGGLKDELFMYLDDAEFCLRVLREGLELYYEPSAVLYHAVGPGLERTGYPDYYLYFSIRNKAYITKDRAYRLYLRIFTLALWVVKLVVYGGGPGVIDRGAKTRALIWGFLDSFVLRDNYRKRFPRLFRKIH